MSYGYLWNCNVYSGREKPIYEKGNIEANACKYTPFINFEILNVDFWSQHKDSAREWMHIAVSFPSEV